MTVTLDAIRDALETAVPPVIATCAADGTPNVSYLSQIQYIDARHVALSFQFFNKTRENVLADPRATVLLTHPETFAYYRLAIRYLRTETAGALFEKMRAKLSGIASHTGMSEVFKLRGADVYEVVAIETVTSGSRPLAPRRSALASLRAATERLSACADLDAMLEATLASLGTLFGVEHAMVLMLDAAGRRLYTVASRGYPASGVGSEIPLGAGVIGVAARERAPIRISYPTMEYSYSRAIRDSAAQSGLAARLETEIPFPGLAAPGSQMAVPIIALNRVLGVLYIESPADSRFNYDDEDALVAIAGQVGLSMHLLQQPTEPLGSAEEPVAAPTPEVCPPPTGAPIVVRHYRANDSVFLNDEYLIKGVAGAILWKLVRDYAGSQRTSFTNRELRLDPTLKLPDVTDNLEARLILLQRRLAERDASVRIEKTGRGRFALCVNRPLELVES
jgi:adenylate cyclase